MFYTFCFRSSTGFSFTFENQIFPDISEFFENILLILNHSEIRLTYLYFLNFRENYKKYQLSFLIKHNSSFLTISLVLQVISKPVLLPAVRSRQQMLAGNEFQKRQ